MNIEAIIYLLFIHVSLLVPGYVIAKRTRLMANNPGLELCFGYFVTIVILGVLALLGYAFDVRLGILRLAAWLFLLATAAGFIYWRYYQDIWKLRFPLLCALLISLFSSACVGLTFNSGYSYIPDPQSEPNRNYTVLTVKVLNISQTQANDNYIPYRQAQFFINRSDPAKDSFINEWGVTFFQRTPLMGAITASYFNILHDRPPIAYTWSADAQDPGHTYLKFQLIAHVLNALFIIPAFFLLSRLFKRKTALLTCLFLIPSQFFLYNSIFSWPKSFVAFFVLFAWLLLFMNRLRYTILAGAVAGVAYLAHDLAVLYIGTGAIWLLFNKRFRDTFIFGGLAVMFAVPWFVVSSWLYHKQSSFVLYPLSTQDIPQPEKKDQIIHQFFHTSPLRLLYIRLTNFVYLLSPYQLFTSEGGQDAGRRLWAAGLFSIPGSIGFGLIIPAVVGIFKKLAGWGFWILVISPVILETVIIGWPKGLGSLHFAEPVVVLLAGLGVASLLSLKHSSRYVLAAYSLNIAQVVFFLIYSFKYSVGVWFTDVADIGRLLVMLAIVIFCGWYIYKINQDVKNWLSA